MDQHDDSFVLRCERRGRHRVDRVHRLVPPQLVAALLPLPHTCLRSARRNAEPYGQRLQLRLPPKRLGDVDICPERTHRPAGLIVKEALVVLDVVHRPVRIRAPVASGQHWRLPPARRLGFERHLLQVFRTDQRELRITELLSTLPGDAQIVVEPGELRAHEVVLPTLQARGMRRHAQALPQLAFPRGIARGPGSRLDLLCDVPAHPDRAPRLAVRAAIGTGKRLHVANRPIR